VNLIAKKFPNAALIDGKWVTSNKTFSVLDPATGEEITTVPNLGAEDATRAIDAAARALPAWSAKTAKERAIVLKRWFDLVTAETENLAQLMTTEQGKPLAESRAEVAYGAAFIEWFAEEGKRAYGRTIPTTVASKRYITIKQPIGVVAAIAPWNFPIAMITRKVAPALASGCTIVVKPAAETPLCALALAKLGLDAGLPPGVLNIVTTTGAAAIGRVFCEDGRVRKLSFTGSTGVGKLLYRQCADTVKKLTLELGGNAPLIVFDDADLDQAVAGAMASKYRNAGQTCVCANRILVQDGIYERFAERLVQEVAKLKIGNGLEADVTIGPLINPAAVSKVARHIDDALSQGARLLCGGIPQGDSQFVQPTVLGEAHAGMLLANEETFGPVAPLMRFTTEEEALAMANATPYGLGAYFFTQDLRRSWRFGEALEFGMVGLNTGIISMEVAPFGGIKQSGLGREGSKYGLDEYLEVKAFHIGGL
jgi:succinate-semialdehyde dehydrogenase/glutarate-semialdehyde dehydrogenase